MDEAKLVVSLIGAQQTAATWSLPLQKHKTGLLPKGIIADAQQRWNAISERVVNAQVRNFRSHFVAALLRLPLPSCWERSIHLNFRRVEPARYQGASTVFDNSPRRPSVSCGLSTEPRNTSLWLPCLTTLSLGPAAAF